MMLDASRTFGAKFRGSARYAMQAVFNAPWGAKLMVVSPVIAGI